MMPSDFTHFLITRYNVPLAGWEVDKSGNITRDAAWYAHRKRLFDQFCVPSIRAQTIKDFVWLIYCDRDTPKNILQEIFHSISTVDQANIRLVTDYHDCMHDIDQQMSMALTPFIISSRVDNDDGLGINYMATIQQQFIPQPDTILNLLHGHGYDINRKVVTQLINIRKNHFGSLIETRKPTGGHVSIRGFQHGAPPPHYKIINISQKNSWLKIFHDRNLKSSTFGYPLFNNKIAGLYGVDPASMPLNKLNTLRYSIWWLADGFQRRWMRRRVNKTTNA